MPVTRVEKVIIHVIIECDRVAFSWQGGPPCPRTHVQAAGGPVTCLVSLLPCPCGLCVAGPTASLPETPGRSGGRSEGTCACSVHLLALKPEHAPNYLEAW